MPILHRFTQIVLVLALCAAAAPGSPLGVRAQAGAAWRVESITPLSELVPQTAQLALAAPDAVHIAAIIMESDGSQACTLDLASAAEACVPLPEEAGQQFNSSLLPPAAWAPDSQRLAVVGSPLQTFADNDLTVVDFATQSAAVLTPDEITGPLPLGESGDAIIDIQPAWSLDGTRLAVERIQWGAEEHLGRIAVLDTATGDETASFDLPFISPGGFNFGVTMALAWAPDGTTIAWSRYGELSEPLEQHGVWLINVESGEAEQIISLVDVQPFMNTATGETNSTTGFITGFVWAPDGSAALVWVANHYEGKQRVLLYDVAAGTLSDLPRPDAIADPELDIAAAWSPNGSAVIVSSAVAEADPDQMLVQDAQAEQASALWLVDRVEGTSTLLGYVPRVAEASTIGAWNADGDVLLAGYRLRLARE